MPSRIEKSLVRLSKWTPSALRSFKKRCKMRFLPVSSHPMMLLTLQKVLSLMSGLRPVLHTIHAMLWKGDSSRQAALKWIASTAPSLLASVCTIQLRIDALTDHLTLTLMAFGKFHPVYEFPKALSYARFALSFQIPSISNLIGWYPFSYDSWWQWFEYCDDTLGLCSSTNDQSIRKIGSKQMSSALDNQDELIFAMVRPLGGPETIPANYFCRWQVEIKKSSQY